MTPEAKARIDIDAQLAALGWALRDYKTLNLAAAPGTTLSAVATALPRTNPELR